MGRSYQFVGNAVWPQNGPASLIAFLVRYIICYGLKWVNAVRRQDV